jgi:hypothetical protein
MSKKTKGAFGSCRTKILHIEGEDGGEHHIVLRRLRCFKCGRLTKFSKKNLPIPVERVKGVRLGYICKVCARKKLIRNEAKSKGKSWKDLLRFGR